MIYPTFFNLYQPFLIRYFLGDGCITRSQTSITLNSIVDADYSVYVQQLIGQLFGYFPPIRKRKGMNAYVLYITGSSLVDYLLSIGMKIGNKVRQQVDVPRWIKGSSLYCKWCLRGVMDTDGGVFNHTYTVNGKKYSYLKTCFTNKSQPLRRFVFNVLKENRFTPKYRSDNKVWLYSETETIKYLRTIGSSNSRLNSKMTC